MASALAAIHAKGIVHRDLKPANVLLLPCDGDADFVKVVDFGISKVNASDDQADQARHHDRHAGVHVAGAGHGPGRRGGPPQRPVGPGLHGLADAERPRPLQGEPLDRSAASIEQDEPPPLLGTAPHVSPQVEKVLRRALAKRQSDRFPTIRAFVRALEACASAAPPPSSRP